jgi:hypothetical protein
MFVVSVSEVLGHARSTTALRDRTDGCGRLVDRGRPPGDAFGRLGSPILTPAFADAAEATSRALAAAAGHFGDNAAALTDTAAVYDDTDSACGEHFAAIGNGGPARVRTLPAAVGVAPPAAPPDPVAAAESVHHAIASGGWSEGLLSGGIRASNPDVPVDLFAPLTAGNAWLLAPAKELEEYLGLLTVHSVSGPAGAWSDLAEELTAIAGEQGRLSIAELPSWTGKAADAYRASVDRDGRTITASAIRVHSVHLAILGADSVIADVRRGVRDTIAQAVQELSQVPPRWAPMMAVTPGAVPFGAIADAQSVVARHSGQISERLAKLERALRNLGGLVQHAGHHSSAGAPATAAPPKLPPRLAKPSHDKGAGVFNSASLWEKFKAVLKKLEAHDLANAAELIGYTDAARHMRHYLDASGDDLEVDPGRIMRDVPTFKSAVDQTVGNEVGRIAAASSAAHNFGTPVPFHTGWKGHYNTKAESPNWFYAIGGMQYSTTGYVTTYPPPTPGGQPVVEVDYRVDVDDRYNWDKGKGVHVGPVPVADEYMGSIQRAGLAKEYDVVGSSETFHYKGNAPAPGTLVNLPTPDTRSGDRSDPSRSLD